MKASIAAPSGRRARDPLFVPVREYTLTVEGELSEDIAPAFVGMTLTRTKGKTLLVGPVRDQAELQGVIQQISNLGLTLLSASASEDDDE